MPKPADKYVAKGKIRKLGDFANAEGEGSSNEQSSSARKSSSTRQSGVSVVKKSRDEAARERNRLAQKRFRARQKEKYEKQVEDLSEKEHKRIELLSEQESILKSLRANAQLLSVRQSLFSLYKTDEPSAADPAPRSDADVGDNVNLSPLPTSLGANMASLVLQSGQNHLASAITGQIENADYTAQFVSDPEERKGLSLLSSTDEAQKEFQRRANVVKGMLQTAQGDSSADALLKLKENPEFLAAQQKMFTFLWGMFCVNPSLALVWFAENSAIDPQKYAQAAKMLYAKIAPDGMERLRKLHSAHSLGYEKRQAKLQLLMDKVKKALRGCPSASEYSAQSSASMFVTLQECTDAICEVAKEEFSSLVPFGIAFSSEFDLIDLSVLTCDMAPQIVDTYAMVTAVLREDFNEKSLKK